jgi:methylmalonyl-CoA mutase cobalamin-binding subunit
MMIVVGGVIPPEDYQSLYQAGAAAFSVQEPAVHQLRGELESKVRSGEITAEAAAHQLLAAFSIS